MPNHQQNCVVIKRNRPLLLFGAVAVYLSRGGVVEIVKLACEGYCFTPRGAIVTGIYIHWIALILFLGACALVAGSQRLLLDDQGIQSGRMFLKRRMSWALVCDWGISCNPSVPWEGTLMHLYFSSESLPPRGKSGKKLSKQTVRILILRRDWEQLEPVVLSYCKERLEVKPFDGLSEIDLGGEMK